MPRAQLTRRRILIVDDDQDTREMYSEFLTAKGYEIVTCGGAREALRLAFSQQPDVIVTDIPLPGEVDGAELLESLRADARTSNVGVIVLTAIGFGSNRERAERSGCDAYLVKPCMPDALASEIRRIVVSQLYNGRRNRFVRAVFDRAALPRLNRRPRREKRQD